MYQVILDPLSITIAGKSYARVGLFSRCTTMYIAFNFTCINNNSFKFSILALQIIAQGKDKKIEIEISAFGEGEKKSANQNS